MSNALTQSGGNAVAAPGANPFAQAGAGAESSTFMKFQGASGDFTYGQDDDEMPHGTQLAADIEGTRYSWAFWWDGEVLETNEVMVLNNPRAFEQEPEHLPDDYDDDMSLEEIRAERKKKDSTFMDGWSCQGIVTMRTLTGDMEQFTLKLNNGVGMRSFQSLLGAYGRLRALKEGKMPIVELGARKYKSKIKSVGTRYAPDLKIVDWKSEEEMLDAAGSGEDASDYDDAPAEPTQIENKTDDADTKPRGRGRRGARANNLG